MADQLTKEDCFDDHHDAFKSGNKQLAGQLLPSIRPAVVRTTFQSLDLRGGEVAMVTLLHLAAYWGWKDVVILLVTVHDCVPYWRDRAGQIPLHYAAYNGHLEVVKYFITEQHCDPIDKSKNGGTPLHIACIGGHLNIVQYLISEAQCNPSCENKFGYTPLRYASSHGHLNIVQYLISEQHCNPSCEDTIGNTPLHYACINGHLNIVQYLISEAHCNPSCESNNGNTPLHWACICNHAHIVRYLLSTGRVNPLAESKSGSTPLSRATGKYDIIKLLQPFIDSSRDYPIDTFTKLILIGDSGAGKTTIAQLVILVASKSSSSLPVDCVADVQRFTAGIVPHHIESNLGNFVMYDFAGQQEYYSSHAAILEQVMRKSAAMFICMVDLSKSNESICESLQYWLSFTDNACTIVKGKSHVVIVGSHADLVQSSEEMEEKRSLLHKIATVRAKHQEYVGYVNMDCRQADTDASRELISILTTNQKAITASQPAISVYCHILYAFLCTKLDVVSCPLQHLISAIIRENDSSLPSDPLILTEFLATLSDKGLILFLKSTWIVVKTESLLNEINGTLFAPCHFREHRDLASNTGIVPVSNLHKVFLHHNTEMLIGFLESLDFCRQVDRSVLQYTNLQTTTPSHSTADLLFFPGLIQSKRPDSLIQQGTLQFGWCLGCMDDHQFLSSRFLHVLLLSVAYKFPLASRYHPSSSLSGLQRKCTVWRNGIYWRNDDNINTVVELLNNNRWVVVAMSYNERCPVMFAKLRSSLITLVCHLQQEHCTSVHLCEFLISSDHIQQYPFDDLPDTALFEIDHVARSILCQKEIVLSYKDGHNSLETQSLHFEPYHFLTPAYVCQLFDPNMSDKPVPVSLLHEVEKRCCSKMKPQVYSELREYLDSLSIFAGRNPLEVAELKEEDLDLSSDTTEDLSSDTTTDSSIFSIADLGKVKRFLNYVNDWQSLGLELGLLYPTLERIEEEQRGAIIKCKMKMLAAWLKRQDNVSQVGAPSWSVLQTALKNIGENELADTITT